MSAAGVQGQISQQGLGRARGQLERLPFKQDTEPAEQVNFKHRASRLFVGCFS